MVVRFFFIENSLRDYCIFTCHNLRQSNFWNPKHKVSILKRFEVLETRQHRHSSTLTWLNTHLRISKEIFLRVCGLVSVEPVFSCFKLTWYQMFLHLFLSVQRNFEWYILPSVVRWVLCIDGSKTWRYVILLCLGKGEKVKLKTSPAPLPHPPSSSMTI